MTAVMLKGVPWAPGTNVGAYKRIPGDPPDRLGTAQETKAVAADGSLSYTTLADGEYWASAQSKSLAFNVSTPHSGGGGGGGEGAMTWHSAWVNSAAYPEGSVVIYGGATYVADGADIPANVTPGVASNKRTAFAYSFNNYTIVDAPILFKDVLYTDFASAPAFPGSNGWGSPSKVFSFDATPGSPVTIVADAQMVVYNDTGAPSSDNASLTGAGKQNSPYSFAMPAAGRATVEVGNTGTQVTVSGTGVAAATGGSWVKIS